MPPSCTAHAAASASPTSVGVGLDVQVVVGDTELAGTAEVARQALEGSASRAQQACAHGVDQVGLVALEAEHDRPDAAMPVAGGAERAEQLGAQVLDPDRGAGRISRGRTIKQFVASVILVPSVVSLIWFAIFGGAAVSIQRARTDLASESPEAQLFGVLDARCADQGSSTRSADASARPFAASRGAGRGLRHGDLR